MALSSQHASSAVNISELTDSMQEIVCLLTCASCSKICNGELVLPTCCGSVAYCSEPCRQNLQHCLGCDEAIAAAEGLVVSLNMDISKLESLLLKQTTYTRRGGGNIYLGNSQIKTAKQRTGPECNFTEDVEDVPVSESQDLEFHASQEKQSGDDLKSPKIEIQTLDTTDQSHTLEPQLSTLVNRQDHERCSQNSKRKSTDGSDWKLLDRKRRRKSRTPRRKSHGSLSIPDIEDDSLPSLPSTFDLMRQLKEADSSLSNISEPKSDSIQKNSNESLTPKVTSTYPSPAATVDDSLNLSLPETADLQSLLNNFKTDTPPSPTIMEVDNASPISVMVESSASSDIPKPSHRYRFVDNISEASYFVTNANANNRCARSYEYLKAMATGGIQIVASEWLLQVEDQEEGRCDEEFSIWGDSILEDLLHQVEQSTKGHNSTCHYEWLKSTEWWMGNSSPCEVALTRTQNLLHEFYIYPLGDDDSLPLQAEQADLLCVLAGARTLPSLQSQDLENVPGNLIILIPDEMTKQQAVSTFQTIFPNVSIIRGEALHNAKHSLIVRQSWLLDSLSASDVAPLDLYTLVGIDLGPA